MLAPGYHLYGTSGGEWRYRAPGDVFVKINGNPELLAHLLQQELSGNSKDPSGVEPVGLTALASALADRGVLVAADAVQAHPRSARVHIDGENSIADQLERFLDVACVKRGTLSRAAVIESDVVITCADWLPDSSWLEIDEWCRSTGTAWHMSYFEDTCLAIGPPTFANDDPRYADTRARRLAAAPHPDELVEHWRYLESDAPSPRTAVSAALAAVAAGTIAHDIHCILNGEPVAGRGFQRVLHFDTGQISLHPVLALPNLADPYVEAAG